MTADEFRKLALSLPEVTESAHQNHPDFRVGGKIFATIGPNEAWGMVKLTPEQQASHVDAEPAVYEPFNGAWGRGGATKVRFDNADESSVLGSLAAAWRNTAPDELAAQLDGE